MRENGVRRDFVFKELLKDERRGVNKAHFRTCRPWLTTKTMDKCSALQIRLFQLELQMERKDEKRLPVQRTHALCCSIFAYQVAMYQWHHVAAVMSLASIQGRPVIGLLYGFRCTTALCHNTPMKPGTKRSYLNSFQ